MTLNRAVLCGTVIGVLAAGPLLAGPARICVGVQQNVTVNVRLNDQAPPLRIQGMMDYGNNLVYVKAEGFPKEGVTAKGQKRWTARESATLYAARDLALMLAGATVGGRMSAKEGQLVESIVVAAFKARVKFGAVYDDPNNAKMKALGLAKDLGWNADDETYTIVMEARLNGAQSVADAWCSEQIQQAVEKISTMRHEAAPSAVQSSAAVQYQDVAPPKQTPAAGSKTGLIVICDTLGVQAGLAPKIFRGEAGDAIFGSQVPTKVAVETGAVGYAASEDEARKLERVGANPIVVKGIARRGNYGVAISDADADMLAGENEKGKFFDRFAVVFVVRDDAQ